MENVKEFYFKHKFTLHLSALLLLFIVNCFWGEFVFISLGFAIFLIIMSPKNEAFSVLIFCIPFIAIDTTYSFYLYLLAVCTFVVKAYYTMFKIDKKKPSKFLIGAMAVFILYLLLPIAPYNINFLIKIFCFILLFLIIYIFLQYPDDLRLKYNVGVLTISLLASSLMVLLYFISPYLQATLSFFGSDFIRFAALIPNPNSLAMICEICLAILVFFFITKRATPCDVWYFIILATLGLSTMSKTFIIILGFLVLVLFFYVLSNSPLKALLALFIIAVPIVFLLVLKNNFVMYYFDRFVGGLIKGFSMEKVLNVVTTGRYGLWLDYLAYTVNNPLILIFGAGLGAPRASHESPHNFFISLLYHLGIVGIIILIVVIVSCLRVYKKNFPQKIKLAIIVPLFVLFLIMLVEDFFLFIWPF